MLSFAIKFRNWIVLLSCYLILIYLFLFSFIFLSSDSLLFYYFLALTNESNPYRKVMKKSRNQGLQSAASADDFDCTILGKLSILNLETKLGGGSITDFTIFFHCFTIFLHHLFVIL